MDDQERAAILRAIERSPRRHAAELPLPRRLESFDEIEGNLDREDAVREARRCLTCGCRKAECCELRQLATEYGVDPYRFAGARRRFARDNSHPDIVYEAGKCIMCDACVRIAARAAEPLGVAIVGRGFDVRVAVPFDRPLSEGLTTVALECAQACPTGALSVRSPAACDFCADCRLTL
jgi:predicted molibdopterin-dependent oxidoreductase YjgC